MFIEPTDVLVRSVVDEVLARCGGGRAARGGVGVGVGLGKKKTSAGKQRDTHSNTTAVRNDTMIV